MHEHTVAALNKTLAETIGEVETLKERIEDRTLLIDSTRRLILHYNPQADLASVKGVKVRGKAELPRGAVSNAVIKVMKAGPLKVEVIVERVANSQGVTAGSEEYDRWESRVKAWLHSRKTQGKVAASVDEAGDKSWTLIPFEPP